MPEVHQDSWIHPCEVAKDWVFAVGGPFVGDSGWFVDDEETFEQWHFAEQIYWE